MSTQTQCKSQLAGVVITKGPLALIHGLRLRVRVCGWSSGAEAGYLLLKRLPLFLTLSPATPW